MTNQKGYVPIYFICKQFLMNPANRQEMRSSFANH